MPEPGEPPAPAALERLAAGTGAAAARVAPGDAAGRIRALLLAATPLAGFVSDDGASTTPAAALQWVVAAADAPAGAPRPAVSIAAAVDGEVVAGVVVDVARGERFSAHLGGGARRDGRPIGVVPCGGLAEATVEHGGSAALGLCRVACGVLHGWAGRGVEVHEHAAGALIAEEAGAVTELPCPENDDLTIAATPGIFAALRAAVELPAARPGR